MAVDDPRVGRATGFTRWLAVLWGLAALSLGLARACRPRPQSAEQDPLGPDAGYCACYVTFVREELSVRHLNAGVACVRCHGVSAAHARDESLSATKPDVAGDAALRGTLRAKLSSWARTAAGTL